MQDLRKGSHSTYQLHVHLVWRTKYRYGVLKGDIQIRCRDLLRQTCDSLDVQILKGVVSKDHVHLHVSYPPKVSVSELIRRFKREKRQDSAGGIFRASAAVLWRTFLGYRLRGLEHRKYNR